MSMLIGYSLAHSEFLWSGNFVTSLTEIRFRIKCVVTSSQAVFLAISEVALPCLWCNCPTKNLSTNNGQMLWFYPALFVWKNMLHNPTYSFLWSMFYKLYSFYRALNMWVDKEKRLGWQICWAWCNFFFNIIQQAVFPLVQQCVIATKTTQLLLLLLPSLFKFKFIKRDSLTEITTDLCSLITFIIFQGRKIISNAIDPLCRFAIR